MISAHDSTCARFLVDMLGSTGRNSLNQRFSLTTNFSDQSNFTQSIIEQRHAKIGPVFLKAFEPKESVEYCRVPASWGLQQTTRAPDSDKTRAQGSFGPFTGGWNFSSPWACGPRAGSTWSSACGSGPTLPQTLGFNP